MSFRYLIVHFSLSLFFYFYFADYYSMAWIHQIFIRSPVEGHLGCFQV